jgi:hypothetical protein
MIAIGIASGGNGCLATAARARAGDDGAVDAGAGQISRRVRQFRSGLAIPQAEAEAASADPVFNAPADRDALASYRDAGIARVLLEMHDLSCDEVLRVLDKNAPLTSGA